MSICLDISVLEYLGISAHLDFLGNYLLQFTGPVPNRDSYGKVGELSHKVGSKATKGNIMSCLATMMPLRLAITISSHCA